MRSRPDKYYWALAVTALLAVSVSACKGGQGAAEEAAGATAIPGPTALPAPTDEPLPDLVISGGEMTMPGFTGGCVAELRPLVTEVCVLNQGEGNAGPFEVRVKHRQGGGAFRWEVEGLAAGEEHCFEAEGRATGRATADADDVVTEADEFNNNFIVPSFSSPPVCTPTAFPTETPTSLPLAVPSATPFPEGSRVTTEIFPVYNCRYLGNEVYEWYRVKVTYLNGEPVSEEVVRGPYRGEWQGGCPPNPAEPEG